MSVLDVACMGERPCLQQWRGTQAKRNKTAPSVHTLNTQWVIHCALLFDYQMITLPCTGTCQTASSLDPAALFGLCVERWQAEAKDRCGQVVRRGALV